ncbi:hypothetical protein ScPMuIL_002958 [Solemya velum]
MPAVCSKRQSVAISYARRPLYRGNLLQVLIPVVCFSFQSTTHGPCPLFKPELSQVLMPAVCFSFQSTTHGPCPLFKPELSQVLMPAVCFSFQSTTHGPCPLFKPELPYTNFSFLSSASRFSPPHMGHVHCLNPNCYRFSCLSSASRFGPPHMGHVHCLNPNCYRFSCLSSASRFSPPHMGHVHCLNPNCYRFSCLPSASRFSPPHMGHVHCLNPNCYRLSCLSSASRFSPPHMGHVHCLNPNCHRFSCLSSASRFSPPHMGHVHCLNPNCHRFSCLPSASRFSPPHMGHVHCLNLLQVLMPAVCFSFQSTTHGPCPLFKPELLQVLMPAVCFSFQSTTHGPCPLFKPDLLQVLMPVVCFSFQSTTHGPCPLFKPELLQVLMPAVCFSFQSTTHGPCPLFKPELLQVLMPVVCFSFQSTTHGPFHHTWAMSIVPHSLPPPYQESKIVVGAVITTATQQDTSSGTTNSGVLNQTSGSLHLENSSQVDTEKHAIYRHPLFPLLALLFEKCEKATQTPDCPSSDSFDVDIQSFVHHQEKDRKPFFSDDPELDNLMVKAIQVLRIHLLELEKVTDLCKDFCNRYISCLKGKLQSENLLRIDDSPFDSPVSQGQSSSIQTPIPMQQVLSSSGVVTSMASGGNLVIQQGLGGQTSQAMATLGQNQIVSGGTVYQMVQTPQGLVAQPIQIQTTPLQTQFTPSVIHGSTPLSQIGVVNAPVATPTTPTMSSQLAALSAAQNSGSDDDDYMGKKKNKRGVLPKSATQVMKSWLFQHIVHPYPTEEEKKQIAVQTNLTLLQVNNWFINARRRILQPMLDSSNPEQAKTKKSKPQNRPLQRFWPESIANIQPQLPTVLSTTASPLSQGEATASNKQSSGEQVLTITVTSGGAIMTSSDAVKLESMSTMLGHANSQSMSDMLSRQQDEDNSDIGLDHSDSSLSEQ